MIAINANTQSATARYGDTPLTGQQRSAIKKKDQTDVHSIASYLTSTDQLKTVSVGKGLLDRHIVEAMQSYDQYQALLSPCEYVALWAYTLHSPETDYYKDMTQCAREETGSWENMTNVVVALKSAISKLSLLPDSPRSGNDCPFLFKGKKKNDPILTEKDFFEREGYSEKGFFSTTPEKEIAYRFMSAQKFRDSYTWEGYECKEPYFEYISDSLLLMIRAKGGVDISNLSTQKIEKEILFDAPEFRVVFKGYSQYGIKNMVGKIENVENKGAWVVILEDVAISPDEGHSNDRMLEALDLARSP